jgi:hypothetical protein
MLSGEAGLLPHQTVQQLARTTDERQTLTVLFGTRTLSDEHEIGMRVAHAEDDIGPVSSQPTAGTF